MKNLLILCFAFMALNFGCSNNPENDKTEQASEELSSYVVEIFHFHGERRCNTCLAVEEVSTSTLEENFKSEVDAQKVRFVSVNIDEEEGEKIAEKFEAYGSGLYIRINKEEGEEIEDLTELAYGNAVESPGLLSASIKSIVSGNL